MAKGRIYTMFSPLIFMFGESNPIEEHVLKSQRHCYLKNIVVDCCFELECKAFI